MKLTLVFWLLLRALVGIMAFLLTSVVFNVREVFLVLIFILVLPDCSGVDASSRGVLVLALLLGPSSTRATVLFFLRLCR